MALFNWKKSESEITTATKTETRRPKEVNRTESFPVNKALTQGLFHNSFPGLKLSGALAFTPIAVPVWFMGFPVVKADDETEELQAEIQELCETFFMKCEQINLQSHREGNIAIYPHFSTKTNTVIWDFIHDDSVTDIIKDIETNEPIKIITEERITVSVGYNETASVISRKEYTKQTIHVKYTQISGVINKVLLDKTTRNVAGILPINFNNNSDGDEWRGHSDYERIVPDLKSYHDIEYADLIMLAKFNVKMVQTVKNYEQWKENLLAVNGWSSVDEIDHSKMDTIINQLYAEGKEETAFVWPQGAHQAAESKLKTIFKKIVEGSGIPEIFWGLKTEGNHASAQEQMNTGIMYVEGKRRQKTNKYQKLFDATIRLWAIANMKSIRGKIKVTWNDLDAVSPETKSVIFANYAKGINSCLSVAGMTKEQLHGIWEKVYPEITEDDFETYSGQLQEMAKHKQFTEASFQEGFDFGLEDDTNGV